jgi:hypothetical protein
MLRENVRKQIEVISYLEKPIAEIGTQLIGSPANQAAADNIRGMFFAS